MSNYSDLIGDAQTERQVDMVVEDILSAIASICDALDKGEMVEHVAKRKGLSPYKVRNIYRVRNRRMRLALENFYKEVLAPVQVQPQERMIMNTRKTAPSKGVKSKAYVRKLIDDLKERGVQ